METKLIIACDDYKVDIDEDIKDRSVGAKKEKLYITFTIMETSVKEMILKFTIPCMMCLSFYNLF